MAALVFKILLIINIFQEALVGLGMPALAYSDEILIIISIYIILVSGIKKKAISRLSASTCICSVILFTISISNPHNSATNILLQTIIHLKFFFYFSALITLIKEGSLSQESLRNTYNICFLITIIGLALNFIFQDNFISAFGGKIQERAGSLRLQGFQLKPNDLAIFAICYFYFLCFKSKTLPSSKKLLAYALLITLIILLNGSRTALIGIPILLLAYAHESHRLGRVAIIFGTLLVPAIFFQDQISYAISETVSNFSEANRIKTSLYIRGIMIYYSFVLAAKYFPIGTGAASFGSVLSKGSPVYDDLGIGNLSFFHNMDGVYDSNLASILGEFGLVGILIFTYLLFQLYRSLQQNKRDVRVISLLALLIITSSTNPLFFYQHNSIVFAMTLTLISIARTRKQ